MSIIKRIPDHVLQGLDLLLTQFKGKPRLAGWTKAYLRQVQDLEDAIYDVIVLRMIDNAVGAQLDAIGRLVGELRNDRVDALYKIFIRARIRINRSKGTNPDLIDVLTIINNVDYLIDDYPPASILIEFADETEHDPVLILGMLRDTKAGGVGLNVIVPTAPPEMQFLWGDLDDTGVSDNGFGDADDPDEYGLLSDAVTMPA